jgi:ElaB/YqjD/DUF883 family membrane-anchored ribosome-binding protein
MANQDPEEHSAYARPDTPCAEDLEKTIAIAKETAMGAAGRSDQYLAEYEAERGRRVISQIDEKRERTAAGLESVGASLHEKASTLPGGEKVSSMAHTAADKLEATAGFVRRHKAREVATGVDRFLKRHPGQSLIAAVVLGFLAGRIFRNH